MNAHLGEYTDDKALQFYLRLRPNAEVQCWHGFDVDRSEYMD
jgi:hypothetical protein